MTAKLLPLVPKHLQYCELFFGGGSLFFAKAPCPHETINDLDEAVMGFFSVLRDHSEEFIRLCNLTPYHEGEWKRCRAEWAAEADPVRRAWMWFVVARQSFSGCFGSSQSHTRTKTFRGRAGNVNYWQIAVERLPQAVASLKDTQILCGDWQRAMECTDTPDCFHYLDPPYAHAMRTNQGPDGTPAQGYLHELSDGDHDRLVAYLLSGEVRGRVMLSGYASPAYVPLEAAGWQRVDWQTSCHAAGRTRLTGILGAGAAMERQRRVESVWLCPRTAAVGHLPLALAWEE